MTAAVVREAAGLGEEPLLFPSPHLACHSWQNLMKQCVLVDMRATEQGLQDLTGAMKRDFLILMVEPHSRVQLWCTVTPVAAAQSGVRN